MQDVRTAAAIQNQISCLIPAEYDLSNRDDLKIGRLSVNICSNIRRIAVNTDHLTDLHQNQTPQSLTVLEVRQSDAPKGASRPRKLQILEHCSLV